METTYNHTKEEKVLGDHDFSNCLKVMFFVSLSWFPFTSLPQLMLTTFGKISWLLSWSDVGNVKNDVSAQSGIRYIFANTHILAKFSVLNVKHHEL